MDDEITLARKNRIKKVRKRRTLWFLAALAIVLVAAVIMNTVTATTFKDIKDFAVTAFRGSAGYPVSLTGAMPKQAEQLSLAYAVLTDEELLVYSNRGAELLNCRHEYISPLIEANGNRIALYNMGGKDIEMFNRSERIAVLKTDYSIISAAVSDYGTLAVLTRSEKYTSQLEVYGNGKYQKQMTWYGSSGFPLFVAMQRSGNRAAVVSVTVTDGVIKSRVTAIDTKSAKELFSAEVNGLGVRLYYDSNGYITLVTDEAAAVITAGGEVKYTYAYGEAPLLFAACDEGRNLALCFGDNNQQDINRLVVLGTTLEEKFSFDSVGEVDDIYMNGSRAYVLGKGRICEYSMSGEMTAEYEADNDSLRIIECGKILTLLPDRIERAVKIQTEG